MICVEVLAVLGLFSLAHEESPSNKAQNPSHCFLLTCDTRVLVYTRFWAATNIEERTEHRREKEAAIHQLPVFTAAAQKSINPQRLNRWIVPIFGQQLHSIWANILDG